jgi:hypothetical protein
VPVEAARALKAVEYIFAQAPFVVKAKVSLSSASPCSLLDCGQ